jgi:hypothetical protein
MTGGALIMLFTGVIVLFGGLMICIGIAVKANARSGDGDG